MGAQKFQFAPIFPPKWKIISFICARNSQKRAKVAQKLRSTAKIARLRKNAKVAQKLRSATSQFSGGTTLWKKHYRK